MANKYMKKCSTPLVIKEMQTEITVIYDYILPGIIKINNTENRQVGKTLEQLQLSYISSGNVKILEIRKLWKSLVVKYKPILEHHNSTPMCLFKRNETRLAKNRLVQEGSQNF